MPSSLFEKILAEIPEEENRYQEHAMDIAHMLSTHLKKKRIDKKELAKKLDISMRQFHNWLSGGHNFSIAEISMIEAKLGIEIIPFLKIGSRRKNRVNN
jgi:transcriptional regulator with XRE-family HTH domain